MKEFGLAILFSTLAVHVASLTIPYSDLSLQYTGRVLFGPKCAQFDWSGVEIAWSVSGTDAVSVELGASNNTFNVFIDDKLTMILNGTETMESFAIAQLDASQPHNIKITKRTEALFGPVCFASVTLQGPSPAIHPTTNKKTHLKIEYIGDSITCGYGILGKTVDCPFTRDTEDYYETFGAIIARKMNAAFTVAAWSGKGVCRNYGTPNITSPDTMVDLYPRTLGSVDFSSQNAWNYSKFVPDTIIIKLGANDYSTQPNPPDDLFISSFVNFVLKVRQNYVRLNPKQLFVFPCGPTARGPNNILCTNVKKVVQILTSDYQINAFYADIMDILDFPQDFGCGYHPSVTGHQKIATKMLSEFFL
eukprot:TRINITY_DN14469_c0_g1_i1.p1 TRINITY_DN14469_c0_g1~~TRINITY_DN14469_c0_g1_i1.p1  ORF type:complete len:362 (-),score=35.71 TRINITY_DN14469_c0_g1_i1:37-1122(-)